jgi:hypothetical protein
MTRRAVERTVDRARPADRRSATVRAAPPVGSPAPAERLQTLVGNRAASSVFSAARMMVQTKLEISQPGDVYEQEADRVAEQVMRMPQPALQRCACGGACASCAGTSLMPRESNVRIHRDAEAAASAAAVRARAYTVGSDVVFARGAYAPGSAAGRRLLAHELTHVVQQAGGVDGPPRGARRPRPSLGPSTVACGGGIGTPASAGTVGHAVIEPPMVGRHGRSVHAGPLPPSPPGDDGRSGLVGCRTADGQGRRAWHSALWVDQPGAPPVAGPGRAARRVQRFTTAEHTDIGNAAFALARHDLRAVGAGSPLRTLLERGSRFHWGEQVKTYGDLVADADFFDTFADFLGADGKRATGFAGQIDEGRLATRNLPHFTPHNVRAWAQAHDLALDRMRFAHHQLAYVHDLLHHIDPLLEGARRAILAGQDARAERLLSLYRARFEPIRRMAERVIPQARRLAWQALLQNAYAEHYLTDAFSAGHIVTPREEILREAGVDPSSPPPSRAGAVRGALLTSWAELRELRAQARSLAWHDLDNYYGVEVAAASPGFAPWLACGDGCSARTADPHWHATRAMAIRANEESIKDLWRAGLTGVRPPDYRAVLDLLPRPTWRRYPGWDGRAWRNQLKYIRGESVPHAPGTQLPGVVATVLWPIEHCVDLTAGCADPYVGTSRDWIERWSMSAWVRPMITRVAASAATRYDYAAIGRP